MHVCTSHKLRDSCISTYMTLAYNLGDLADNFSSTHKRIYSLNLHVSRLL